MTRARRIRIDIGGWRAPLPGWTGRLGPIQGVTRADTRMPASGPGPVRIRLELSSARPIREVIGAIIDLLVPNVPMSFPQSPSVGSNGDLPPWLSPGSDDAAHFLGSPMAPPVQGAEVDVVDVVSGIRRGPDSPPPNRPAADAELVTEGGSPLGFGLPPTEAIHVTRHGVLVAGVAAERVLLDVRGRPTRRWQAPEVAGAHGRLLVRLRVEGTRWRLVTGPAVGAGAAPTTGPADEAGPWLEPGSPLPLTGGPDPFTWWSMACDIAADVPDADAASLVTRLALSGVVMDGRGLSPAILAHLSEELARLLVEPLPAAEEGAFAWEFRSVRQRRAVIRGHATALVMPDQLRSGAAVQVSPPSVSVLLVTRRPQLAASALWMMRDQTYPRLEIIVGLHGVAAVEDLRRVAADADQPVEIIEIPAATTLGEALGIVTAHARGSLVVKVDDDDIYGPEHIWDLVVARALSGATVIGKATEFVMLEQLGITVRRDGMGSDAYNRVIAGGTIMLSRGDLERVGGWRPVRSGVDRALLDRVLQGGGLIYRTWPVGFIYRRHGIGHTWDPADDYFLRGVGPRWDGVPDLPGFGTQHVRPVVDGSDDPD